MDDFPEIDTELSKLVADASETKILKKEPKLIKPADISKMPDMRDKVQKMHKDGFTSEQIAAALGFPQEQIAFCLDDKMDLGSPEQILQESLKILVSLIPVADAVYRSTPTFNNSLALTGIIDSSKGLIQDLFHMKDKEETFRMMVSKVLQPAIRGMISDMMVELRFFQKSFDELPDKEKYEAGLQEMALSVGKKFDDTYRRACDALANSLGLNPDARARALASIALGET